MNASDIIRAAIAVATLAGLGLFYASQNHSAAINEVRSSAGIVVDHISSGRR